VIPAAAAIISAIEHALDAFGVHITEANRPGTDSRTAGFGQFCRDRAYWKNVLDEWTGRCGGFATGVRIDLPLNFHPAAIRASAVDTPIGAV
jgi:hypothetical protein